MNPNLPSDLKPLDRRSFLAISALGALGLPFMVNEIEGHQRKAPLGKIALQLYTVRREIEKDLNGTLRKWQS